jgi:hypothetical protein
MPLQKPVTQKRVAMGAAVITGIHLTVHLVQSQLYVPNGDSSDVTRYQKL